MAGRYRYYKRKLYFSTQDRILLHLLDFVGFEDQFQQPDEITQFGIADAIGLGRSTVSKAIRRLEQRRLVRGARAHVPSGKLRRTVYVLTPQGVSAATQKKREIEEEIVTFRESDGRGRPLRMAEVPRLLPQYATLLDVAAHVSEGVFDPSTFQVRPRGRFVDITDRVPRLRYFFGREKELAAMDDWLASPAERALVITGITGIGKTTLISKKVEAWRGSVHLFFHRIMEWTTLRNVVQQLAELLTRLSKKGLGQYLEAKKEDVDIEQVVAILAEDLAGTRAVLMFDDYHNANPSIRNFFTAFRAALEGVDGPKLVVLGRSVPPFYDRREVRVKKVVREMPLPGLDAKSSERLLALRNLPLTTESMRLLYQRTGGHPLFLELVDSGDVSAATDIHKYLEEEMFARITEPEAKVLSVASVFRYPIPVDALFIDEDVNLATIRGLLHQSLLREVSARVYEVHDVVRSFFLERLSPQQRRQFNRWAAQFHVSQPVPDFLETVHHFVEAEDMTSAARVAVGEGRGILRAGHSEELLRLVERMLPVVDDIGHSVELRLLKAHVLNVRGELDAAVALYEEITRLAPTASLNPKIAEAHRYLGDILRRRGQLAEAERTLDAALRIYRGLDHGEGVAETTLTIGSLAEDRSDLTRAERMYQRSMALGNTLGLRAIEAEALFAHSRILVARGDLEGALARKESAVAIAEGLANWHLQARFQVSLGTTLQELDRWDEAMRAYATGVETARRIGDLRMLAYGLWNSATGLVRKDDLLRAEAYLKEADALFRKLREPLMEGLVTTAQGFLWEKRGKWPTARHHLLAGLDILRKGGYNLDFSRQALSAAHLFHRNGDDPTALALLQETLAHARRLKADRIAADAVRYLEEYTTRSGRPAPQPGTDGVPSS